MSNENQFFAVVYDSGTIEVHRIRCTRIEFNGTATEIKGIPTYTQNNGTLVTIGYEITLAVIPATFIVKLEELPIPVDKDPTSKETIEAFTQ